jgi:uncharacterized membrane protein YdbT with pleckstrin-like domain
MLMSAPAVKGKMGYIERNLAPGETVVYKTGCHWIVLLWPLGAGLILGSIGLVLFAGGWLATRNGGSYPGAIVEGSMALFAAAALVLGGIVRQMATEVAVSNQRVLIKTGLFSQRSVEILLARVESVGMKETFAGRILGYGTVMVRGTGGTSEEFERIRDAREFRRRVRCQLNEAQRGMSGLEKGLLAT